MTPPNLPPNLDVPTLGDRLFAALDQRLNAALIDLIAIILLYLVTGLLLSIASRLLAPFPSLPAWAALLLQLYLPALAYNVLALRLFNATAGKRLLGIQVVRTDGSKPGWTRALLREIIKLSPMLPIALLMMALRNDNRSLHDLLADTAVVHATPGIPASRIE